MRCLKKFLTIWLFVVYAMSVSGATVKFHYCGGDLADVQLSLQEKAKASCCGDEAEDNGCCKNEQVKLQIADENGATHPVFDCSAKVFLLPEQTFSLAENVVQTIDQAAFVANNSSPPGLLLKRYKTCCNFRI